jgi:hypothetical protein
VVCYELEGVEKIAVPCFELTRQKKTPSNDLLLFCMADCSERKILCADLQGTFVLRQLRKKRKEEKPNRSRVIPGVCYPDYKLALKCYKHSSP